METIDIFHVPYNFLLHERAFPRGDYFQNNKIHNFIVGRSGCR